MAKRECFRSKIIRGIEKGSLGIDRNIKHDRGKGAIFGYAVIAKGPLNAGDSRNWEMDDISLEQVVEFGNAAKLGLKSRFGHPGMCTESLGTFLGRAKNFRKDGDVVRADLFFDDTAYKTPNGDLANYINDLAENDPDAFGSSLVFACEFAKQVNPDGTPKKDEQGKELPDLVRFTKLFASDIVDDPAATPGMFGQFFNESVELSAKATEFLDKLLSSPEAVERVINFLERYKENRVDIEPGLVTSQIKTKLNQEEVAMELKDLTVEVLRKECPDLVKGLETEATKNERARVLSIVKAEHGEFAGKAVEAITEESVEKGFTLDASLASMRGKVLKDIEAKANPAPGADTDAEKGKQDHLARAKAYQAEHNCGITEALKATVKVPEPAKK